MVSIQKSPHPALKSRGTTRAAAVLVACCDSCGAPTPGSLPCGIQSRILSYSSYGHVISWFLLANTYQNTTLSNCWFINLENILMLEKSWITHQGGKCWKNPGTSKPTFPGEALETNQATWKQQIPRGQEKRMAWMVIDNLSMSAWFCIAPYCTFARPFSLTHLVNTWLCFRLRGRCCIASFSVQAFWVDFGCPLYTTNCVDGPGSGPVLFGRGLAAQAALGLLASATCSCGPLHYERLQGVFTFQEWYSLDSGSPLIGACWPTLQWCSFCKSLV